MNTDPESNPTPDRGGSWRAPLIIAGAIALLIALSYVPWSDRTGGLIKDFSLFADILSESAAGDTISTAHNGVITDGIADNIDPELLRQMEEDKLPPHPSAGVDPYPEPMEKVAEITDTVIPPVRPSRVGDTVEIEDYTTDGEGMKALREAIRQGRMARIAFVGDSYIEGDIMCQDFRSMMQTRYGGRGVGYMNLHSDFPGFRRSVRQSGSGWKDHTVRSGGKPQYISLTENYFSPSGEARAIYRGTPKVEHADSWSRSRMLFVAPSGGEVKMRMSDTARWEIVRVDPSPEVRQVIMEGMTSYFEVASSTPSLVALGVWLDGASGVSVDCMSSRGFSGLTLAKVDSALCAGESRFVDYQLIILEFGINAMSARQTDYTVYGRGMIKVINHLRRCYPAAQILVMGIGDRGEKAGGKVRSMISAPHMIEAQRDVARKTRCLFWDTREAMGGDGAIVDYASRGLANKDYVHLTHKGGRTLAEELFKAFTLQIDR